MIYGELAKEEAQPLVTKYKEEARKLLPPSEKRANRRNNRNKRNRQNRNRGQAYGEALQCRAGVFNCTWCGFLCRESLLSYCWREAMGPLAGLQQAPILGCWQYSRPLYPPGFTPTYSQPVALWYCTLFLAIALRGPLLFREPAVLFPCPAIC